MSNRQRTIAISTEFEKLCAEFAAKHGLISKREGTSYSTGQEFSFTTKITFGEASEEGAVMTDAQAKKIVDNLVMADALAYPKGAKDILLACAMAGRLYKFGREFEKSLSGPITGWNNRAPKAPLQFTATCKSGVPCASANYKTRSYRADNIGIPADASSVLDIQVGDECLVDYVGDGSPEDQSGLYLATIVSLGTETAEVRYDSYKDETFHVEFANLIVRPRFI